MHARTLTLAAVVIAVVAVSTSPVAAQPTEPAFVVSIEDDGSATVSVRMTFDLTTDSERAAFRSLANDSASQAASRDRFLERMRSVANATESATGRSMAVTDASIAIATADDTGVVTLSVTWRGLVRQRGDRLLVAEPFASEFAPERPFVLRAPAGYSIESVTPAPESRNATSARWPASSELDGFEAVVAPVEATPTETASRDGATPTAIASPTDTGTPTESPTDTGTPTESGNEGAATTTGGQPGFGAPLAIAAVLAVVVLAVRRARR